MSDQTTPGGNLYFTTTNEITDPSNDRQRAINRDARDREVKEVANNALSVAGESLGTLGRVEAQSLSAESSAQRSAQYSLDTYQLSSDLMPRVENIETMAGLSPGEVTDAQTANLISQASSATRSTLDATYMPAGSVRRIVVSIDPNEPLDNGDLLILLKTRWFTDFTEYRVGHKPDDWSVHWSSEDTFSVEERDDSTGGVVLEDRGGTIQGRLLSWDAAGAISDVEVVMKWRTNNIAAPVLLVARGAGERNAQYGYNAGVVNATTNSIREQNNASSSNTLVTEERTFSPNTWYTTRFRVTGSQQMTRTWQSSLAEPPTWDLMATDTTHSEPGLVGLYVYSNAGTRYIDWIGISIDGSPAPTGKD